MDKHGISLSHDSHIVAIMNHENFKPTSWDFNGHRVHRICCIMFSVFIYFFSENMNNYIIGLQSTITNTMF